MTPSLTAAELGSLDLLADAWNAFFDLPVQHPCDRDEFCRAIHAAQHLIMARPAQRELNAKRERPAEPARELPDRDPERFPRG